MKNLFLLLFLSLIFIGCEEDSVKADKSMKRFIEVYETEMTISYDNAPKKLYGSNDYFIWGNKRENTDKMYLLKSEDGGESWSEYLSFDSSEFSEFHKRIKQFLFGKNNTLFFYTHDQQLYRFSQDLKSYTLINDLMTADGIKEDGFKGHSSKVFSDSDGVLYSDYGLRSLDNGNTWTTVTDLAISDDFKEFLLAGNSLFKIVSDDFMYCSIDKGETWQSISGINREYFIFDHVWCPYSFRVSENGDLYLKHTEKSDGFYKSADKGLSWDFIPVGDSINYFSILKVNHQGDIYINRYGEDFDYLGGSGYLNHNIFKSSDNGKTWELLFVAPFDYTFASESGYFYHLDYSFSTLYRTKEKY